MRNFARNLSVSAKVYTVVGFMTFGIASVFAYLIIEMEKVGAEIHAIAERDLPLNETVNVLAAKHLDQAIRQERATRLGLTMNQDSLILAEFEKNLDEFKELAIATEETLQHAISLADAAIAGSQTDADRTDFKRIRALLSETSVKHDLYEEAASETIALISSGSIDQALENSIQVAEIFNDLEHNMFTLVAEMENITEAATIHVEEHEKAALQLPLILSAIILIGGFILAWQVVRRSISKPLHEVVSAIDALIAGDTDISVKALNHDEIGAVARALSVFRDKLIENDELEQQTERQRQQAEADNHAMLMQTATDLEQSVGGVVSIVSAAATQLQASAQSMSANVLQTSEQANRVAAHSTNATGNVSTVASATEELSRSISEIDQQAATSLNMSRAAVDAADHAATIVSQMSEMAVKVDSVVSLITEITERTNLLALNATIEAARAGDAGKGFAVVASEVKSLASQTAGAADEVSKQISEIQQVTSNAKSAIDGISRTIAEFAEIAVSISTAAGEQNSATQDIAKNIQDVSHGNQEVTSEITAVSNTAQESGTAAKEVLGAASELSEQAEMLNQEVTKFLRALRAA